MKVKSIFEGLLFLPRDLLIKSCFHLSSSRVKSFEFYSFAQPEDYVWGKILSQILPFAAAATRKKTDVFMPCLLMHDKADGGG